MPKPTQEPELPATSDETLDGILAAGGKRDHTPIRIDFLQRKHAGKAEAGPLSEFVASHDLGGLRQYLLLLAKASKEPWNSALSSPVWARALGHPLPNTKTAASSVSKTWLRLENRHLVSRGQRVKRMASVTLLREDGSGEPYTHPGGEGSYFKLPHSFWRAGRTPDSRWFRDLNLPETAALLISLSLKAGFRLPLERGQDWYGISADSLGRGFAGLEAKGALLINSSAKKAPLSPLGVTHENRYTLITPFVHRVAQRRTPKKATAAKKQTRDGKRSRR